MRPNFDVRPATAEEIATEQARRIAHQRAQQARAAFDARDDVMAAREVHGYVEHHLERVIDALTPAEWENLAQRLQVQFARTDSGQEPREGR